MLKNIILFIICIIIIIYIFKYNERSESFTQIMNPYNISSNNITQNSLNDNYEYNQSEECFNKIDIFNRPINISIAFKNDNMNNYNNSRKRKLFCTMDTGKVDPEYNFLLNNSLPYNNPEIYTGENLDGNDWEIIPLKGGRPPQDPSLPKINKCGFLIRNIDLNRYLSYGFLLKEIDTIQDNNIISEENLRRKIVYTGPHKYINEEYLWDVEPTGCNTYSLQHIQTGLYLNSTIVKPNSDFESIDSENFDRSELGEISCIPESKINWFIVPIEPLSTAECEDPYETCEENLDDKYSSIGGKGRCCYKQMDTKLCLQGDKNIPNSKVLNYPQAPWCGIKDACGVTYNNKCMGNGYKNSHYSGDKTLCKYSDPPKLSPDGYKLCDCSSLNTKEDCDKTGSSGDCKWITHMPV